MSHLSGERDTGFDLKRNMIVGGCVFGLLGPVVTVVLLISIMEILLASSIIEKWYPTGVVLHFFAGFYRSGFFVPAALAGIFMGWLGTRFRRGWTICGGTLVSVLLISGYSMSLSWIRHQRVIDFGVAAAIVAIFPSFMLSWRLRRWIKKRAARDDAARAG